METHDKLWTQVDRLEHAVRKVDMAQWEHDRFMNNIKLGSQLSSKTTPSEIIYQINLLTSKMKELGMKSDDITRMETHFRMACHHQSGLRMLKSFDHLEWVEQYQFNINCQGEVSIGRLSC